MRALASVLEEYGVTPEQMAAWGVDPAAPVGWEFPEIGHAIGESCWAGTDPGVLTMGRFW